MYVIWYWVWIAVSLFKVEADNFLAVRKKLQCFRSFIACNYLCTHRMYVRFGNFAQAVLYHYGKDNSYLHSVVLIFWWSVDNSQISYFRSKMPQCKLMYCKQKIIFKLVFLKTWYIFCHVKLLYDSLVFIFLNAL